LPKKVAQELDETVTVAELMDRLELVLGIPDLRAKLTRYCAIVVDGTSIQHLQGWDTPVRPGAMVAVVAPMGGGAAAGAPASCGGRSGRSSFQ
jgi:molybdopterin converting factor small subunit